ncbi:hypothetical protein HPB48_008388 [Haemaphysalis longicornis]|uniref:RING-type domain-containing protein n=1 Tax=Haemaphysalis longicornis TaxID=44386 RepID=A0A9J6FBI6_HAELO|nr:hypothetical protein HPB48_008388 [Haemaphysalis longicornis]
MASAMPGADGHCVLRGFGGFLDCRRICFVDSPPRDCVCDMCGEYAGHPKRLPCGHTVCVLCPRVTQLCFPFASTELRCPVDNRPFLQAADYLLRPSGQARMWRLRVRCINASGGCDFVGPLHELERHCRFACEYVPVAGGNASKRSDIVSDFFGDIG